MDSTNLEKAENRQQVIKKWYDDKDVILKKYNNHEISLKERAILLTKATSEYNDNLNIGFPSGIFIRKYPDLFTLDKVYEQDFNDYANIELTLVVDEINVSAIAYLLRENQVMEYSHFMRDNYHFYRFFYSLKRGSLYKENDINKERKSDYLGILGPNSIEKSLTATSFNYLKGLIPVGKIFGEENTLLKDNFYKIDYACYLALNNGGEIHSLREIRNDGPSPKFHEDLQEIFRSNWEANIARILNYKKIEWKFEKEAFLVETGLKQNSKITYHPDFFLNDNVILEVKGFWDIISVSQVYAFKNQIKDHSLKIIDGDMYHSLIHRYKDLIQELELENEEEIKVPPTENVPLVGIQRRERLPFIKELNVGDKVYLQRDKNNKFDNNAILVVNKNGKNLGFMGKEWASIYAEKMDLGMEFEVTIKKIEPKVIFLSIRRTNVNENVFYDFLNL